MKKILFFLVFSSVLLLGSQATAQTLPTTTSSKVSLLEGQELTQATKLFYRELLPNGNGAFNADPQTIIELQANTVLVFHKAVREGDSADYSTGQVAVLPIYGIGSGSNDPFSVATNYYVDASLDVLGTTIDSRNNIFLNLLREKISK